MSSPLGGYSPGRRIGHPDVEKRQVDGRYENHFLINRKPIHGKIVGAYFNHGGRRTEVDHREVRLGRAFLVTRLQTLLQLNRMHLPSSEEVRTLAAKLMEDEVEVAPDANDHYGALKVGNQDDLVTAFGLAYRRTGRGGWPSSGDAAGASPHNPLPRRSGSVCWVAGGVPSS